MRLALCLPSEVLRDSPGRRWALCVFEFGIAMPYAIFLNSLSLCALRYALCEGRGGKQITTLNG